MNFITRVKIRAFTLAELMVAVAVLSIFLGFAFGIYRFANQEYTVGIWKATQNQKMIRALKKLRKEIEAAGYPVKITEYSVEIDNGDTWDGETICPKKQHYFRLNSSYATTKAVTGLPTTSDAYTIYETATVEVDYSTAGATPIVLAQWLQATPKIRTSTGWSGGKKKVFQLVYDKGDLILRVKNLDTGNIKEEKLLDGVEKVVLVYKSSFPPEGFKSNEYDQNDATNPEQTGYYPWDIKGVLTIKIKMRYNLQNKAYRWRKAVLEDAIKIPLNVKAITDSLALSNINDSV